MNKKEKKKTINIFIIGGLVLFCFFVLILYKQIIKTYNNSSNNIEKLSSLKMDATEKDIKFNNKLNLYFFWGNTCPHCKAEFQALQDAYVKYEDKIFLYGLEVFSNKENNELMKRFVEELDINANGVPFLVIADKYYVGFYEGMDKIVEDEIKKQIKNKNRVDIYKNIKEKDDKIEKES